MTTTDKIVTLARHYCIDNYHYWVERYQKEISGQPYNENDYNLFPRYQVLNAILEGVEELVGRALKTANKCKIELKEIGKTSENVFTKYKHHTSSTTALRAMADERQKFTDFIDSLTIEQIENVKPLPFRRKLLKIEAEKIRESLKQKWNFDGYWEPLNKCSPKPFIFFDKENLNDQDLEKIKEIIISLSNNHIYEITEDRRDYKIDNTEFDPDCYETVYTDKTHSWIVYGSHERTVAFGGDKLLSEIEKQLNDKEEFFNVW